MIAGTAGIAAILLGSTGLSPAPAALAATAASVHADTGTTHDPLTAGGSTWAEGAVDQWDRNVWANYQWLINYSGTGSTQGRSQFCQGVYDFGVTDIPYGIANSNEADSCTARQYVYMPITAGGTSIMYNLSIAGKRVTNLRLSGETFAKIFTGVITRWNDPEIQAENPNLALPAIPIVPVVRSDGSGATAQVTIWMRQMYPQIWDAYCAKVGRPDVNGDCGVTSFYPLLPGSAMISRAGDNSVAAYTAQPGNVGTITYVEYSYALSTGFPVAKLLNSAGYYTQPTAGHVAVSLLKAQINNDPNSQNYLTEDLSQVYTNPDPRTYELSSYSYIVMPTTLQSGFNVNKGLTLADYGAYLLCEGQQIVDQLGYSALPINLVQAGQQQIQKIPGGNPTIKTIAQCNNPTFSADGTNKLADDDPMPPACDKEGPVQCTTGTGGAANTSTDVTKQSSGGPAGSGQGGADGTGSSGSGNGGAGVASGKLILAAATPQSIPQPASIVLVILASLAGLAVLGFAIIPPVVRRRRRALPFGPPGPESR
ncbi:MAG: substrate-binding domain-containing protein [Galbitalea sp.]